eukprot:6675305-Alexandrium_andersonii.AAC.1
MDYCFLTKDGSETSLAVLVFKDRDSRAILAHPVLRNGRLREDIVDQLRRAFVGSDTTSKFY